MRKEEKRRKFHDALVNIYSPPQPPHPQKQPIQLLTSSIMNQQIMPEPVDFECDGLCMDPVSEVNDLAKEMSSDDVGEFVPQKLTRAQRKRIRKKKLKEDASRRRKIIGPLLPTHEDVECEHFNNQNENVQKTIQAQDISIKSQDSSSASDVLEHTTCELLKE